MTKSDDVTKFVQIKDSLPIEARFYLRIDLEMVCASENFVTFFRMSHNLLAITKH